MAKKKACKSKCDNEKCDKVCSKKPTKRSVKKILSSEPLVYIEPLVPEDTVWTKILKFFKLK